MSSGVVVVVSRFIDSINKKKRINKCFFSKKIKYRMRRNIDTSISNNKHVNWNYGNERHEFIEKIVIDNVVVG